MKKTKEYDVILLTNIKKYLSLPDFKIEISKNSYNVYECHIKDFNLYVHSAEKSYDSAFLKIKERIKGLVIAYILEALASDRALAIYGKNASKEQNQVIAEIEKSYNDLIKSKKRLEGFISSVSIPSNYSLKEINQIKSMIDNAMSEIKKVTKIKKDFAKEILSNILNSISLFHFEKISV